MANRIRWTFKLKIASTSSATGLCASGAQCKTEDEREKKHSKIQPNCRLWWLRANNKCELNTHCWHSCHTFWALFSASRVHCLVFAGNRVHSDWNLQTLNSVFELNLRTNRFDCACAPKSIDSSGITNMSMPSKTTSRIQKNKNINCIIWWWAKVKREEKKIYAQKTTSKSKKTRSEFVNRKLILWQCFYASAFINQWLLYR